MKHTPGPWIVDAVFICQSDGENLHFGWYQLMLAEMNPEPAKHGINLTLSREVAEANARLIASAPDLLKALELFMALDRFAFDREAPTETISDERYIELFHQCAEKAEAAIRKAKGE